MTTKRLLRPSSMPVKICCIQTVEEAAIAMKYGATILGLVSKMPSGWGPIAEAKIAEIVASIPPGIVSCLLTSRTTAEGIIEQQRACGANALQLVDGLEEGGHEVLRRALPGVSLLQAVHVYDDTAIAHAQALEGKVDGLILDTGNPNAETKVLGGTGQTHDWSISARIVEAVSTPVFLAGGLKMHNVAEAIGTVRPFGLDLCTGVRSSDDMAIVDEKVADFMRAVRAAEHAAS